MENQSVATELRFYDNRSCDMLIVTAIDVYWLYRFCIVAPNSCLQYYTGVSGTIRSFNYDGVNGRHLSNQDYSICIRTESSFCSISYMMCSGLPYSITGPSGGSQTTPGTPIGALVRCKAFLRILMNISNEKYLNLGWISHLQFRLVEYSLRFRQRQSYSKW